MPSRQLIGPSWSASSNCARPKASAPLKPIWNAQDHVGVTGAEEQKTWSAAAVATHGCTPLRRMSARTMHEHVATCRLATTSWYTQ